MLPINTLLGSTQIKDSNEMEIRETNDPDCYHFIVVNKKSQQGYNIKISTDNGKFDKTSKCKVSCNCDNFQFQWGYVLFKNDGLYNPHRLILTPPVEKNPNMVIGCCKHIKYAIYKKLINQVPLIANTAGNI